ncbi:MAG: hypothetical protein CMB47_04935 [Euryarchaeota archaeon]|nr:hypothetical protein [Euryarchaeota archaeon]|tara:strand:+ start:40409 stop:42820 length:2412 start_codon:yes stop_codon:yes gene_type:complete
MKAQQSIYLDTETWSNQEFTEVIASRYFILGQETNQQSSWEVRSPNDMEIDECLILLNNHLESLGLIGILSGEGMPVLSIINLPISPSVSSSFQQFLIWILMSIFLTIVGAEWLGLYDVGDSILDGNTIRQSLFYFTFPIIFSLLLCSNLRYWMAKNYDIDSGHIIPIIFPILYPTWPFGLTGILSQKRIDKIPFPNRKKLAIIESILPISIFFLGATFTMIGLSITSNEPPDLEDSPIIFDLNPFTQTFASLMFENYELKLQWLHPIGIAGIGLSMIGWILLLPIPGFPGDRLLYSIFGTSEMSKGNLQTSLFIISLVIMMFTFAFVNYLPWLFLIAFSTWQRFSPENSIIPFIVNQSTELSNNFKSKITILLISVMIIGFPGLAPITTLEEYDSGLSTSNWETDLEIPQFGEGNITLDLRPKGILPVSGFLQFSIEGSHSENWEINSTCELSNLCHFSNITQNNNQLIKILIHAPDYSFEEKFYLRIIIDVNGYEEEHMVFLYNNLYSGPTDVFWEISENTNNPKICTKLNIISGDQGNLSLTNPFWNFVNSSIVNEEFSELCLIGHEGALFSSNDVDQQFRRYGPTIQFIRENNTTLEWLMPIENTEPIVYVSDAEWTIPFWLNSGNNQYSIIYGSENPSFCKSSDIVTEVGSNWTLPLEEYTPIKFSKGEIVNGTIIIPSSGWIMICDGIIPIHKYIIEEGLDVIINPGSINNRITNKSFTAYNRENFSIPVSVELYGDSVNVGAWEEYYVPNNIDPFGEIEIILDEEFNNSLFYVSWISIDNNNLIIHNSVRCPVNGC